MKKITFILLFNLCVAGLSAQLSSKPSALGVWTDWSTITYDKDDKNPEATVEYRIMLDGRTGIACNYQIEVKNTSSFKMSGNVKVAYWDYLVNSAMGPDVQKYSLNPGQSKVYKFKVQGCTKQGKKDENDAFKLCSACEMSYEITRFYK